jgi:hypothetical protein
VAAAAGGGAAVAGAAGGAASAVAGAAAAGACACAGGADLAGVGTASGLRGNGGGAAQPASAAIDAPASASRAQRPLHCTRTFPFSTMWLILLEAALALGLLVFIVWWTMFHRPRRKPRDDR